MREINGKMYWNCGCITWREGKTFYCKSCGNEVCSVLRIVHKSANEKSIPIEHIKEELATLEDLVGKA